MRKSFIGVLAIAGAALAFAVSASAAVPPGPGGNPVGNPGYETGCIALPAPIAVFPIPSWDVNPPGSWLEVPSNLGGVPGPAQSGFCFALGTAGATNTFQTLRQTVNLGAGNQIRGYARFTNREQAGVACNGGIFNDVGRVVIYRLGPIGGSFQVFFANVCNSGIPIGASGPWTLWTFTAPSAGAYMISYEVENRDDSAFSSQLSADSNGLGSVSISPKP